MLLHNYIDEFGRGRSLKAADAEPLLDAMIAVEDESALENLFRAWHQKGIDENEIFLLAKLLRERCTKVYTRHKGFVDIVGTGGSRVKTFNVSTAAAFVTAGGGLPVAKHGNRSATSKSGSADVIAALGIEPSVTAETAGRCLDEIGICFMFAPNFHSLSPSLAKVRRGLGFPTVFNCLGPLCNPASAPHQLIGVNSKELLSRLAGALAKLGTTRSWVVHGKDGSDEISLNGPTLVAEVANGNVKFFEIEPARFGIDSVKFDFQAPMDPGSSARLIREIFENKHRVTAAEQMVVTNAAAALHLCGHAQTLEDGNSVAVESLRSGGAIKKLKDLAECVNR